MSRVPEFQDSVKISQGLLEFDIPWLKDLINIGKVDLKVEDDLRAMIFKYVGIPPSCLESIEKQINPQTMKFELRWRER